MPQGSRDKYGINGSSCQASMGYNCDSAPEAIVGYTGSSAGQQRKWLEGLM